MSKRKKGEMTPNAFESARTEGTGEVEAQVVPSKRKKLQQQEGVEDTLEMFCSKRKSITHAMVETILRSHDFKRNTIGLVPF